ncbi:MAG TPA: 3-hydroxyacyl-CoA dehydrogenase family protein [Polyangiaceae bacterium LLY-WYZ-15_(1-7)]|nr:3-hydroxybutyryl-CoA dehydrogenase [Sandaracinus sp.]HJL01292.1 3-hydroxyacyl-CoA dehydrogenase family protein [Polyangiaceae bacterium LLY-WYZ-15_(1-7)]MBJ72436.1 3-hydroxybutyryl-CoA dehydrogenase [Sandaracinus sp.]HJL10122.1 3-hydroxyacyl-CoA dehydrogenase family protein [Polyangiaceae bacterium LLY-WYZ-15_(1-7)]HJL21025.1 3-hydroxyacyl-CoA dehydrogenase family protein [Polyangiaceae bacterium LLY-WYZ-15_(1-7)]
MSEIRKVAVLGAGTMGHGIAQVSATAGCEVVLGDVHAEALEAAKAKMKKSLDRFVAKEKLSAADAEAALGRIRTTASLSDAVGEADLVVEAIPEKMELKLELFREVSAKAPPHALFATNTSSLSVTEIAADTGRPERVVGLHFFNPVPVMKLLEIVRGLSTDDETVARARAFAEKIGKEPIVVNDWPGFATSRLGIILGCEAIRMVEQGVASPEDIDKAMVLGYRHPMGPLKLTDLVGLDVRLHIMEHLHAELGEQFRPPALLRQMVRAGKLGRKTGEGFYTYD